MFTMIVLEFYPHSVDQSHLPYRGEIRVVPQALHSLAVRSNVVQRNVAPIRSETPEAFCILHLRFARALLAPSRPKTTWRNEKKRRSLKPAAEPLQVA